MIAWKKLPQNPIVPIPKKGDPDFGKYASWDPHAWREGDRYYAIFGGSKPAVFRSPDLVRWQHVGPLMTGDRWSEPDEDVSCPDFFRLGDKYVLVCISHKRGARYFVGDWRGEQFHPTFHARMNWPGGTFFAPETLVDPRGRRILWAWVLDRRAGPAIQASGSSGEMSLPRVLSWNADGTLRIEPAEELAQLRQRPRQGQAIALQSGRPQAIPGVEGDSWELSLDLDPGQSQRCGLVVRRSPDDAERTVVEYDRAKQLLRIDFSKSTLDKSVVYRTYCMRRDNPEICVQEAPLELKPGERLRLRIFLDRSMLEVFANDRQCVTQRIYPTRADSLGVRVFAEGGPAAVNHWEAWDMAPTNPW